MEKESNEEEIVKAYGKAGKEILEIIEKRKEVKKTTNKLKIFDNKKKIC